MEITEGCLDKYDVAKLVIKPPYLPHDIVDIEITFLSKTIPGYITGFITMDAYGRHNPRSHGSMEAPISRAVRSRLRVVMSQLVTQLLGEIDNG